VTRRYHTHSLEGFTVSAVTGHSRRYQQPVRRFLRSKNKAVHVCLAYLLIYIYIQFARVMSGIVAIEAYLCSDFDSLQNTSKMVCVRPKYQRKDSQMY
jgi:hypothetical protein